MSQIKSENIADKECIFLEKLAKLIYEHYQIDEIDSLLYGLDLLDILQNIELK